MSMKPSLQFRLSQHLALTPQLQQSIRLLQLSTLELHQEVEQMLEANPFLEMEEDFGAGELLGNERPAERTAPSDEHAAEAEGTSSSESMDPEGAGAVDKVEFGATERDDWENGTEGDDFDGIREMPSSRALADDDSDPLERTGFSESLQDHLRHQLRGMRLSVADAAAVHMLIDSLNEDGYLADPLEEIAQRLAPDLLEHDPDAFEDVVSQLRCGLSLLRTLEPIGVGASSLAECLMLQLRVLPSSPARTVALAICKDHLELLARRDIRKLVAATGAEESLIKEAQALIVVLEPKPGRPFVKAEANIVIPDVIVQKAGRGWKVVLNPDVMPKLRINDLYAQALKQHRSAGRGSEGGDSGGQALASRLQEARWFVKNIQQRFDTILRVSTAIVERQKNFFSHGEIAMKPLVLREIADELGLHESTISRVTTAKYMSTSYGTFELKYFFGSSLNTDAGGNASSTAVRALIKQLIAAEDANKPLSDSQLSQMLEEQGIQVARRTVAKYREALKIAPANLRKAL